MSQIDEMDEIVSEFLLESNEGLDAIDRDLVALEDEQNNEELLGAVFRCIHSIKGTCGFLEFHKLEALAHAGENVLSKLRDGELRPNAALTDLLLKMVDSVRGMLRAIEAEGNDGSDEHQALIEALNRAADGELSDAEVRAEAAPPPCSEEVASRDAAASPAASPVSSISDTSVRVRVELLDQLMNLVSELVLTRNQIVQAATDTPFASSAQQLNLITSELQESVIQTRMQPIASITSKLPRVVRDLAQGCGKRVRLEVQGAHTELDKTLIEAIKDPLTHIVRNAVDHGIEEPAVREGGDKPAEGKIILHAYHEGGQVTIEVRDDGGGISPDKLRAKAVERGLLAPETTAAMSDEDAVNLVFHPGFSTAAAVTNISGRGVGMDVVRTNIEKIGGSVDLSSVEGQGTTLKLKIPLTLAIIPALMVRQGAQRYAIPQTSLLEMVRLEGQAIDDRVEWMHKTAVCRLRERLLPLIWLGEQLGGPMVSRGELPPVLNIVVLQAGERYFGLVVDEVDDTTEIVVKPLGSLLQHIPIYAGATIAGDGRVGLILDVLGLAEAVSAEATEHRTSTRGELEACSEADRGAMLVVRCRGGEFMGIYLSSLARLEEIPVQRIERAEGRCVVQYRDTVLTLVRLDELCSGPAAGFTDFTAHEAADLSVIVTEHQGRTLGLVVDEIVDIASDSPVLKPDGARKGVVGTAVVQDRVTTVLDLAALCAGMYGPEPLDAASRVA